MKKFNKHQITFLMCSILFFILSQSYVYAGDIAVIVNKENSTDEISFKDLIKIFKQEKKYWKNGKKIYLIMQEAGSHEKRIVLKKIYRMNGIELKKLWLTKIFREEISSFPKTLGSNQAVRQFVSQVPNAVGFIDIAFVNKNLKVLRIAGKLPGEKGYVLSDK